MDEKKVRHIIERWQAVECPPNDFVAKLIEETIAVLYELLNKE